MYWKESFLFLNFFTIFIISGVGGEYCFRNRIPDGNLGQCDDFMPNVDTIEECCSAGGSGWTAKRNGRRCENACRDNVKFCFRTLTAKSQTLGSCTGLIGRRTREDCCRQGGQGWTNAESGKRCVDTCQGVIDEGPAQFCFGSRNQNSGRCPKSSLLGSMTKLHCCQNGGAGWSAQKNGRECQSACEVSREIDGGWSNWSEWDLCSASCGDGIQRRRRTCDNPTPNNGGADCIGSEVEEAVCRDVQCPINGGWGEWQRPGKCSATCHLGSKVYRQQKRVCNNPPPQFGGMPCQGPALLNVACNDLPHCPVDGGWSEYDEWSACSQTCDDGTQIRTRTCTNPLPKNGGRRCKGKNTEEQVCHNQHVCPTHGGWTEWGRWSPCNFRRCGIDGSAYRYRSCTNPPPKDRGLYCIGRTVDRKTCTKCKDWGSGSGSGSGDFILLNGDKDDNIDEDSAFSYSFGGLLLEIEDLNPSILNPLNEAHELASDIAESKSFSLDYNNVDSLPQDSDNAQPSDPRERARALENLESDSYSFDDVSQAVLDRTSVDDSS